MVDFDPDSLNINSKGKWVTAYLTEDPDATIDVNLDGSNSYDSDGDEITYYWTITNSEGMVVATSAEVRPSVSLSAGVYYASLVVDDGQVNTEDTTTITVNLLDISTIYPDSVYLNGVAAEWGEFQDPELMVKFDRASIVETVEAGDEVNMVISGAVSGSDTIKVIDKGKKGKGKK